MKLLITGSALLASIAHAGLNNIQSDLSLLVAQNSSMWSDRSITTMLGSMGSLIDTYGCWCYFDDNHGKGKGRAVNDIDKVCKDMAHGYDCAIMDAEAAGNSACVPWEVNYVGGTAGGLDNLVAQCDANNADVCSQSACKIEGNFVLKFFQMFLLTGNGINTDYQHSNPLATFDPLVDCPMTPGVNDRDRECCGEQPYRFKFKPFDGGNACCGSTVYPTMIQQCCPDNIPRITC